MYSEMSRMWVLGDYHAKQKLQKLVFPEGVAYDKESNDYRTEKVNSVFDLINSFSAYCGAKNKRPISVSANRSGLVDQSPQLSNNLFDDLTAIANFCRNLISD